MPFVQKQLFAIFIVCALFAFFASSANFALPSGISMADIEGRWSEEGEKLVLDLTRCGEAICGQRVEADGRCGRRVLTLAGGGPADLQNSTRISGEYDWSASSGDAPHLIHVIADIRRDPDKGDLKFILLGFDHSVMRRGPALRLYLAKTGEAVCRSNPIS
jgi:hypothetical protein